MGVRWLLLCTFSHRLPQPTPPPLLGYCLCLKSLSPTPPSSESHLILVGAGMVSHRQGFQRGSEKEKGASLGTAPTGAQSVTLAALFSVQTPE